MTWTWLLGMDFGIRDKCAATVAGWQEGSPIIYIPRSYRFTATPSTIADEYRRLDADYSFARVVGDLGGLGAAFGVEMQSRFGIPITAAKKADKVGHIRLFNGALSAGTIKVVRGGCLDLLEEWRDLPWREDGTREAEGYTCDAADSALYVYVACRAYHEAPDPPPPTLAEAMREMEADLWKQREERLEAEQNADWWNQG